MTSNTINSTSQETINDAVLDSSRWGTELLSQEYTDEQKCLITELKSAHGFKDKKLNILKLVIYDWNIDETVKYYKNDKFCINHFLNECKEEDESKCPSKCEHKYNFYKIWNTLTSNAFKFLERILEYILYTHKRPNSSNLYCFYGHILREKIETKQDARECERYFLKSISLNNENCDAHCGYGILLEREECHLYNFKKAMKHYEIACSVDGDPNIAVFCHNYSKTLWRHAETVEEHEKVLFYAKKSIQHDPTAAGPYLVAALVYHLLQDYSKCAEYYEKAMQLPNNSDNCVLALTYIVSKLFLLIKQESNKNVAVDEIEEETSESGAMINDAKRFVFC